MSASGKAIAVSLIIAALLLGLYRMRALAAENERLETQLTAVMAENRSLTSELENNARALAKRESERARLADETKELKFRLGEIYDTDTLAADWADTPCPLDVLECLLGETLPLGPANAAPGGLPPGSPGAATERPHQ